MFKKLGIRIFKKVFKRELEQKIDDRDFKEQVIALVNEKVDLPKLDEKDEEKLLTEIYTVLQKIIKEIVDDL